MDLMTTKEFSEKYGIAIHNISKLRALGLLKPTMPIGNKKWTDINYQELLSNTEKPKTVKVNNFIDYKKMRRQYAESNC